MVMVACPFLRLFINSDLIRLSVRHKPVSKRIKKTKRVTQTTPLRNSNGVTANEAPNTVG